MRKRFNGILSDFFLGLYICLVLAGCAGPASTVFLNTDFDFSEIEKTAVIPFENLSDDKGAAMRVTRIFVTELLSRRAFDVIESGEVSSLLNKHTLVRTADLEKEQIKEIGKALGAQALFLGSVSESASIRSGNAANYIVTLNVRLVETKGGLTIWSATHTEGGRGILHTILGLEAHSKSQVTRTCAGKVLKSLIN